jgi:hypothetical protein
MQRLAPPAPVSLDEVIAVDTEARVIAAQMLEIA